MRKLPWQRSMGWMGKRSLGSVLLSMLGVLALATSIGGFQALRTTSAAGTSGLAAPAAQNRPGSSPLDQAGGTLVRTFGGSAIDVFVNLVQTGDGGYAIAGATGSFGAGGGDSWVVRLDASGNPVWQKAYGGARFDTGESILATSDGGFLVTGTTLSFGIMDDEALAFKLDASGNVQWQRTFGGNFAENFRASAQAADGGFVLAGTTNSFGAGFQDMWVVRINASGDIVWQKTYGSSGTEAGDGIVATSDGGFVVVGSTRLTGNELVDKGWALKLNGDGSVAWQKAFAGNGGGSGFFGVVATSDGGVAAVGNTGAPGTPRPPGAGWAIKLGAAGDIQWQKTFASPDNKDAAFEWIRQTSSGGFVVAGATASPFEARTDGWILNLDPTGNLIWGRAYGGGDQRSFFSGVVPAGDGGFAAVGSTRAFGAGQDDGWIVKTDANGDVAGCTVGSPLMPTIADSTGLAANTNITPANSTAVAMPSNPMVQDSVGQSTINGVCGPPPVVPPPGPTPTPPPGPTPPPSPSDVCPPTAPFFPETGFCIDNPAIQAYFQARGGVDTFGFPVSRSFVLLGFPAQVFQRHVLRVHPDGVKPVNLLDPDVLPVTTVNFATFPPNDPALAGSAPPPTTPNYGQAVLAHLQANVPNAFEGVGVGFLDAYLAAGQEAARQGDFAPLVALEIWGFPTSSPARDPNNSNFIYQRFQRAILHSFPDPNNPAARVTRGILLADNLKFVMTNDPVLLPADLRAQVQGSQFFDQYCPNNPAWLCRPAELPGTDLTKAFERQQQ